VKSLSSSPPRVSVRGFPVAALLVAGCVSHVPPAEPLLAPEAAIARAVAAGADRLRIRELALAREKLALARLLLIAKDYEQARWLAEQALVDAELAAVMATPGKSVATVSGSQP
jgi:Domain of unknown function (DUF4398)